MKQLDQWSNIQILPSFPHFAIKKEPLGHFLGRKSAQFQKKTINSLKQFELLL